MIIVLKNANFSTSNIGTLSTWRISRSLGAGATYEGPISVDKGSVFSAIINLADGYEIGTAGVTITMGGIALSDAYSLDGNVITITIAEVTGNVLIKVPTINTSTGEEEEPETPDDGGNDNTEGTTIIWNPSQDDSHELIVVNNITDMVYEIGKSVGGRGAGFADTKGRAASTTTILAVNGGETITLSQPINDVNLTYSVTSFTDPTNNGLAASNDKNQTAQAWLSTSQTLASNTKYVLLAFKRGDGNIDFSESELALLPSALTIS